jgi:hypothetical protein
MAENGRAALMSLAMKDGSMRLVTRLFAFALAVCAGGAASIAAAAEIAPHRASYTLSLGGSKSSSGVVAITGAMFIEWQEVCDGWTINQRMRFQMSDTDGERTDNDISFSSWEAKDGLSYRFTMRSSRDGEVTETLRGRAELGGKAAFNEPAGVELELPPGTLFPSEHTLVLIRAAEGGEKTFSKLVFDGATQDGAMEVNAVIGNVLGQLGTLPRISAEVGNRKAWRVRMAFFKTDGKSSEPEYETSLGLQDNGVGRDYTFEYPEFTIKSRLYLLEALPKPRC